jgi:2-iminobutanoate/2-iminopropanoate deaminase
MKNPVHTKSAPDAIGPYSQAIEIHGTVYCSGQIGLDPETGAIVKGGIEFETRRVLQNLGAVLEAAGLNFDNVVKTTIFLANLADFTIVNQIYGEHFDPPYPARSTVQVAALPRDALVEIDAVAIRHSIL